MPSIIQPKATKGSQHWLQELVNHNPELLAQALRPRLGLDPIDAITWLSPLETDSYAEYRDRAFLEKLSVHLDKRSLESFWPSGGPQWDALATTSRGDMLLIEAKAHTLELHSRCGARQGSLHLIQRSLGETGQFFGAQTYSWLAPYYQYANRLAHLYLLRQLNGLPTWLVLLYLVNDQEMAGPTSVEAWRTALTAVHTHLNISPHKLAPFVIDLFVDVSARVLAPC